MCSKDRIVQEWKLVDPPCLPRHQPLFGGFQDRRRRRRLLLLIAAQHTFLSWSLMALRWKTLHFHLKWWIVCLSVCLPETFDLFCNRVILLFIIPQVQGFCNTNTVWKIFCKSWLFNCYCWSFSAITICCCCCSYHKNWTIETETIKLILKSIKRRFQGEA